MNKVIAINLNGNAYQLEEDGYEALRAYLENAARNLGGNPDKDEILADIEQSIADKFRAVLGANKTVVVAREVQTVISEMGPVQDAQGDGPRGAAGSDSGAGAAPAGSAAAPSGEGSPKRLYRINDGAMIAGVCRGIAAYVGVDVTIIRLAFVLLSLTFGAGVLCYILMAVILPTANTSAEKAAAFGAPSTAEEFIRRAREGYYGGMKTFGDRRAYRSWKRQFKREMRQQHQAFKDEMSRNFSQWHCNWNRHWGNHAWTSPGSWIAAPILSLMNVVLTLLGIWAVFALITTGAVFGMVLPAGVPLWLGVLILILVFRIITWPLRAARLGLLYGGYGPFAHLWDSFAWIALLVIVVWFARRNPEAHDVLARLTHEAHRAVNAFTDWWNRQ